MTSRTVHASRAAAVLYNLLLSLGRLDELVLLPANVCPIVPLTLLLARQRFEFIDIEPTSLCADRRALLARARRAGGRPVAAVLYVRTYGAMRDESGLFEAIRAASESILLIDDRCCCKPEANPDRCDWNGADLLLYSTGYGKYVDLGSGGFAHLRQTVPYEIHPRRYDTAALSELTAAYRRRIADRRPFYTGEWPNDDGVWRHDAWLESGGSIDPVVPPAELAQAINEASEHKTRINEIYRNGMPSSVQLAEEFHDWRFQLIVENGADLLARIRAAGHIASNHYYPSSRLFGDRAAPQAERLHRSIVNLFNDFHIDQSAAREVARLVREHVSSASAASTVEGAL